MLDSDIITLFCFVDKDSGMFAMYRLYRVDPRTAPCGMLARTGVLEEET